MNSSHPSSKPLMNYYLDIEHTVYALKQQLQKCETATHYSDSLQRDISILEKCLSHLKEDPSIDLWIERKKIQRRKQQGYLITQPHKRRVHSIKEEY